MHPIVIKEVDPGKIETGIAKSVHKLSAPLWIDGQNVLFDGGVVKKIKGTDRVFDTQMTGGTEVSGLLGAVIGSTKTLFLGTKARLFKWTQVDFSATVIGSGYTGVDDETSSVPATRWSMVNWGDWIYATNGVDTPQVYKGTSFSNMGSGIPSVVRIFKELKFHLLGFYGKTVAWSDEDNPDVWNAGATGVLPIRGLHSDVIAAAPLGESMAFYSQDRMGLVSYIGEPFIFGAEVLLKGIGAVGVNAVCAVGRKNYGFSKTGFWETDGVQFNYLDDPLWRKWIQDNINTAQLSKVSVVANQARNVVEISIPLLAGGRGTLSYNYKNGSWSYSNIIKTVMLESDVFDYPIFGETTGYVSFSEIGESENGSAITANVISRPLDGGADDVFKYISELRIHLKDLTGVVNAYVGGHNELDGSITWSSAFALDDGKEKIDLNLNEYVYFYLKIESTTTTAAWAVAGFEMKGTATSQV